MSFWSSEKLTTRIGGEGLVEPFNPEAVATSAYELSLGSQVFLTSDDDGTKDLLDEGAQVSILPGQFGLLITEEIVRVPSNAIAFISIKAGIKFRGLVNVSGFHVDPGFSGRLKFSVYNAGGQPVVLQRSQRVFLIWYSDLNQVTEDTYEGTHQNQEQINPEDVMRIQGMIASPAALAERIAHLETLLKVWSGVIVTIMIALLLTQLKRCSDEPLRSGPQREEQSRSGNLDMGDAGDSTSTGDPKKHEVSQGEGQPIKIRASAEPSGVAQP